MLNKLTPEQEALIPIVRNEWIKFCLDGDSSIDRDTLHKSLKWIYSLAKLDKPLLVTLNGPLACQYGANLINAMCKDKKKLAQVGDQVGDQVGAQVWAQVRAQVWAQVWAQVGDQVRAQVWAQVGAQVRDQVWDQVGDQVGDQYFDFAWRDLANDSGWIAWIDFFKKIGIEVSDKFDKYKNYLNSGPFYTIFLRGIAIVCCRPSVVHKNENFRLHCTTGPAVEWPNGEKYWFLNGIRVNEKIVLHPEKLTKDEILGEKNVDVRREMLRQIGMDRFVALTNPKVLDKKEDYELLSIDLSDELKDCRYLRMKNPSIGIWHVEGVERECRTVQDALNWRAGDIKKEWKPVQLT